MKIKVNFFDERIAYAVAEFCKRVTFDDAYRRAAGETDEERKTNAYKMLRGMGDISQALEDAEICVR